MAYRGSTVEECYKPRSTKCAIRLETEFYLNSASERQALPELLQAAVEALSSLRELHFLGASCLDVLKLCASCLAC